MPRSASSSSRVHDEEVAEPVGRVAVAAHEAQRHRGPPVDRCEVQEAAYAPLGVAREHHERVGQQLVDEVVVRHREAAVGRSVRQRVADLVQLGDRGGVELADGVQLGP